MLGDDVEVLGIVEHDTGVLAAALQDDALHVRLGGILEEAAADLRRAGEGDHVDVRVQAERLACDRPLSGEDIEDTARQTGLVRQLGDTQRRHAGFLRRLDDDGVARRQRRADLPGQHQDREVPGQHTADDADRLANHHGDRVVARRRDLVVDLIGGFGVPLEAMQRFGEVHGFDFEDRLAALQTLQHGQLVLVAPDQLAKRN